MDITKILQDTLANGGGTYDPLTGESFSPGKGFFVGSTDKFPSLVLDANDITSDTIWDVQCFVNGMKRAGLKNAYLGTWIDQEKIYVDASCLVLDKDEALSTAKDRGELAIWDNAAGESIFTGVEKKG